jgi:N-glycosyltransferase
MAALVEPGRHPIRVLCTVWRVPSHTEPLLPVVKALMAAGDEVLVATTEALAPIFTAIGAPVEVVLLEPGDTVLGTLTATYDSPYATAIAGILTRIGLETRTEELIAVAARFGADLVIRDDSELAGYLTAEKLGIPVVCLAGAMSNAFDTAVIAEVANTYRKYLGLAPIEPAGIYPGPVLDYLPDALSPALRTPADALRFRQPLEAEPGHVLPAAIASAGNRPVVFVAIGTAWRTWQQQGSGGGADPHQVMRTLLAALSDVDCVALVSSGGMDCTDLPHADHVTIEQFVPQKLVLQSAQLFCTHGGYNSVRESIRAGVPMLVTPFTLDQPQNAETVARLGLGAVVTDLDPTAVAELIASSLHDGALAGRARAAQRQVLALPGIETVPTALRAVIARSTGLGRHEHGYTSKVG